MDIEIENIDETVTAENFEGKMEDARELLAAFQGLMREVGRFVRNVSTHEWNRVDAYPGWDFDRDMGSGMGPSEWIEEIEEAVSWHLTCARCGETFTANAEKAEVERTDRDVYVRSDDEDSVLIHASCMEEGEEVA